MNLLTEERYFRHPMSPYKEYKRIIYEPGRVARIKLNRPRYLNAMSHALWGEFEDALDRAGEDPECHVVVISGEGSSFCSGDDVMGLTPESAPCLVTDETPEELKKRLGTESAMWHQYNIEHDYFITWYPIHRLHTFPKPVICMVHGYIINAGWIVAQHCDLVFASEDALFNPAGGGAPTIWIWGVRKAKEIAFEHRMLTARECYEFGFVSRIYPTYEILEKETLAYAERVAKEVPATVTNLKQTINAYYDAQGYTAARMAERRPFVEGWRNAAAHGHANRYEGRGMARTPVGLFALKAKLESEGKTVPENILAALARAAQRDDRGAWQRALHQSWRDPERIARAEADAKRWDEQAAKLDIPNIKDRIKEDLAKSKK